MALEFDSRRGVELLLCAPESRVSEAGISFRIRVTMAEAAVIVGVGPPTQRRRNVSDRFTSELRHQ